MPRYAVHNWVLRLTLGSIAAPNRRAAKAEVALNWGDDCRLQPRMGKPAGWQETNGLYWHRHKRGGWFGKCKVCARESVQHGAYPHRHTDACPMTAIRKDDEARREAAFWAQAIDPQPNESTRYVTYKARRYMAELLRRDPAEFDRSHAAALAAVQSEQGQP